MPTGEIVIKVESDLTEYVYEDLECDIRNLLESNGIRADIYDSVTGNNTKTRKGMMGNSSNKSMSKTIRGELIFGDKIWFNDDLGCRLRICGFTQEQVDNLRDAKFVDLTLTDFVDEDMPGAVVNIEKWNSEEKDCTEDMHI